MGYRKFRADQLFDGHHLLDNQSVLVMTEEGKTEDIVSLAEAGDNIETHSGILSPGFINCHCHLELSHMKGMIAEKTGLVHFVSQVIRIRHLPEEQVLAAIEKAEDEMLGNGIVAVGDICNNTLTIPQKLKGRIWYHNFIEASGFLPQLADQRFEHTVTIYKEYERHFASNSIVPHAPYSVSDELWQKIIHFPNNQLLTIHNQESLSEDEFFLSKTGEMVGLYETLGMDISFFQAPGKRSLPGYYHRFQENQSVILVHNVQTSKEDLQNLESGSSTARLRQRFDKLSMTKPDSRYNTGLIWCLCPNANLYITEQLPDVELLRQDSRHIVLGTDSIASNQQLSILTEMQTLRRHFPSITTEELYRWATLNGAKALQIDNILGSFEKGKKPGVVLSNKDLSGSKRLM
jgi:cytosine/adenosine deaminase-related metal-dependent hydrolase